MTTNAPVETRHTERATQLVRRWDDGTVAQTLANLEAARADNALYAEIIATEKAERIAATNRLAEIDRQLGMYSCSACDVARDLASGHTPSPCPECAAKDEANSKALADLREIDQIAYNASWSMRCDLLSTVALIVAKYRPPTDPVAETVREIVEGIWQNGTPSRDDLISKVSAELKSRLPLGGA